MPVRGLPGGITTVHTEALSRIATRRIATHRKPNADAIAQMALDNFVEMRDKVASPVFRFGKSVEHALERALPGTYVSRYELVSFSTTPYAEVRRRVRRQHRILGAVVAGTVAALAAGVALLGRRGGAR